MAQFWNRINILGSRWGTAAEWHVPVGAWEDILAWLSFVRWRGVLQAFRMGSSPRTPVLGERGPQSSRRGAADNGGRVSTEVERNGGIVSGIASPCRWQPLRASHPFSRLGITFHHAAHPWESPWIEPARWLQTQDTKACVVKTLHQKHSDAWAAIRSVGVPPAYFDKSNEMWRSSRAVACFALLPDMQVKLQCQNTFITMSRQEVCALRQSGLSLQLGNNEWFPVQIWSLPSIAETASWPDFRFLSISMDAHGWLLSTWTCIACTRMDESQCDGSLADSGGLLTALHIYHTSPLVWYRTFCWCELGGLQCPADSSALSGWSDWWLPWCFRRAVTSLTMLLRWFFQDHPSPFLSSVSQPWRFHEGTNDRCFRWRLARTLQT